LTTDERKTEFPKFVSSQLILIFRKYSLIIHHKQQTTKITHTQPASAGTSWDSYLLRDTHIHSDVHFVAEISTPENVKPKLRPEVALV